MLSNFSTKKQGKKQKLFAKKGPSVIVRRTAFRSQPHASLFISPPDPGDDRSCTCAPIPRRAVSLSHNSGRHWLRRLCSGCHCCSATPAGTHRAWDLQRPLPCHSSGVEGEESGVEPPLESHWKLNPSEGTDFLNGHLYHTVC